MCVNKCPKCLETFSTPDRNDVGCIDNNCPNHPQREIATASLVMKMFS